MAEQWITTREAAEISGIRYLLDVDREEVEVVLNGRH